MKSMMIMTTMMIIIMMLMMLMRRAGEEACAARRPIGEILIASELVEKSVFRKAGFGVLLYEAKSPK